MPVHRAVTAALAGHPARRPTSAPSAADMAIGLRARHHHHRAAGRRQHLRRLGHACCGVFLAILIVLNIRNGFGLANVPATPRPASIGLLLILSVLAPNLSSSAPAGPAPARAPDGRRPRAAGSRRVADASLSVGRLHTERLSSADSSRPRARWREHMREARSPLVPLRRRCVIAHKTGSARTTAPPRTDAPPAGSGRRAAADAATRQSRPGLQHDPAAEVPGHPVFDQANQGAQEAAAELRNPSALEFVGPTPDNSVAGQIEIVTNAADAGRRRGHAVEQRR